jgi:Holliday junction resolvase
MFSQKRKGSNAERELVAKFWATGTWVCHRIAGSGSNQYLSPDLIAGNSLRKIVVEVKIIADNSKYFPKIEIEELKKFAEIFGSEPYVAVKFPKNEWFFFALDDLIPTEKSFVATVELGKQKGLLFEELIGKNT